MKILLTLIALTLSQMSYAIDQYDIFFNAGFLYTFHNIQLEVIEDYSKYGPDALISKTKDCYSQSQQMRRRAVKESDIFQAQSKAIQCGSYDLISGTLTSNAAQKNDLTEIEFFSSENIFKDRWAQYVTWAFKNNDFDAFPGYLDWIAEFDWCGKELCSGYNLMTGAQNKPKKKK